MSQVSIYMCVCVCVCVYIYIYVCCVDVFIVVEKGLLSVKLSVFLLSVLHIHLHTNKQTNL